MNKYEGKDNYGNPKCNYIQKLSTMDNNELMEETKNMIWFSAYAANNHRSDYHWQCHACADEWFKRDGSYDDNYAKAYESVAKSI